MRTVSAKFGPIVVRCMVARSAKSLHLALAIRNWIEANNLRFHDGMEKRDDINERIEV